MGSLLYSYVQTDDYADKEEQARRVTTSDSEARNWLASKLLASAKSRQQVLNFRSMHIMADLAGEQDAGDANQKVRRTAAARRLCSMPQPCLRPRPYANTMCFPTRLCGKQCGCALGRA